MKIYKLEKKQLLNTTLDKAWDFFSSPENLDALTPNDMGFVIKTPRPIAKIHQGQIINYTVSPILKIPLSWTTEITEVTDKEKFIDLQIKGPYKLWRHSHHFKATKEGVEMTDVVEYAIPFGFLGRIAKWLFVERKLEQIFNFRYTQVNALFNGQES